MNQSSYVVFKIDEQFYAISVNSVKHIIRSAELTPLNDAPELLLGLMNIYGEIIPVFNVRKQLRLPGKELSVSDRIFIAKASDFTVAFPADSVVGVMNLTSEISDHSSEIFPGLEKFIKGVAKFNEVTILIYDIDTLFPLNRLENLNGSLNNIKESA